MAKIFLLLLVSSTELMAASLAGRHVYIIHPGMDTIWGSYMLVVERESEAGASESGRFDLILPQETEDWSPQQGIEKDDVRLKPDGGLEVAAEFTKPETLVVTGFKVAGRGGRVPMSLRLPFAVDEFSIMALEGRVKIESPQFVYKGPVNFSGSTYDTWSVSAPKAGDELRLTVTGIPEGRTRYYVLGGVFLLLLLILAAMKTWTSRPKIDSSDSDFETVGV